MMLLIYKMLLQFSSVQSLSSIWIFATLRNAARQGFGYLVHNQIPEFTQTLVHWVGGTIQPSLPLLSPSPPVFSLSQHQGLFQRVGSLHQMAKYWSFSFNISPSNEHSGLISFRMDWLELLAIQRTLNSLQHHSWTIFMLASFNL